MMIKGLLFFPGEVDLFSVKAALVGGHDFSWFHLGLTLGLFYSTLKTIQRMNRENFSECLGDTLVGWLRKIDGVYREGKPSWRTLARALVHPLVNQRSLAEEIANNYRIEGMLVCAQENTYIIGYFGTHYIKSHSIHFS